VVKIYETENEKHVRSDDYNYAFDKNTGFFARWGRTRDDDPSVAPSIEIADIELTTACSGPAGKVCGFCYKSNTPKGDNMTLEAFKQLFDKLPRTLTQIAYGADANCTSNPDLFAIMEYTRSRGVIPNITVANITDEVAAKLAGVCGAVAVSRYSDKNWCYDSVQRLTKAGLDQVNIHQMVSAETFDQAMETIEDAVVDPRLTGLKAIVFLSLKQKGRGERYKRITEEQFKALVDRAFELGVGIGFDSCGCPKFLNAVKDRPNYDALFECSESCESSLFSGFWDVHGRYFPCSFTPGLSGAYGDWTEGLEITDDFQASIWNHPKTVQFREALLKNLDSNGVRACPLYEI
jgi:hypothetical protein